MDAFDKYYSALPASDQAQFMKLVERYNKASALGTACHDPAILSLPHHQRFKVFGASDAEIAIWERFAPNAFKDAARTDVGRLEIMGTMLNQYPLLGRGMYQGNPLLLMDMALRMMIAKQRFHYFQTTDALEGMLKETDFGEDLEARWFIPPYPCVYIEFGQTRCSHLRLLDETTGEHIVEGCYLISGDIHPYNDLSVDPVRGYDLIVFGSPVDKSNGIFDDTFFQVGIPIFDETASMAEIIQKTMNHDSDSFPEITRRNGPAIRAIIEHIAKALTYINMPDARRQDCKEGSLAAKALAAIKNPAKREKAQRKAAAQYNRIIVGPDQNPLLMTAHSHGQGVRPHFRRGHFRQQAHGPKLTLRRPLWIQPMLIGKDRLDGPVESKNYVVTN